MKHMKMKNLVPLRKKKKKKKNLKEDEMRA